MSPLRSRAHSSDAQPSVADITKKREALEELIGTEGWQIFLRYAAREFEGAGYRARMKQALAKDGIEPKVVDRVADEIFRLLRWPEDQVRELKGVVAE